MDQKIIEELREKYLKNPPEGMTAKLVKNMSDSDLLDMHYFLTEDDDFDGEEEGKVQLVNQLYKLPDVCSIKELTNENSLSCELMLIKLKNDPAAREEIHSAAEAFIVLRLIGNGAKMDDFISLMKDFTILEICRTGTASIEKGSSILRQNLNL